MTHHLHRVRYGICMLLGLLLTACSSYTLREAKQTVQQSDSLWHAGQPYADSAQLAQAYETLGQWALFCPDDYAHACYHYGKLLRANENPVEAMQCFINATHSRTRDYHILGRVYSNMGSMCHLAGEFPLSYDMYDISANMFLRNGDSINYYYALNDMAFELAEQGREGETLVLLDSIALLCSDSAILCKLYETRAQMYLRTAQYDSAVYYSHLLYINGNHDKTGLLIRAQAYSFMGCKDSAVYYANYIHSLYQDLFTLNSVLYILTQDDDSKGKEEVRKVSADRSDTQKLIEIRKSKLSQAVQLLEQDLQRKPNRRGIYTFIAIILTLCSICVIYFSHGKQKRVQQQHKDYSQKRKADLEISCAALRNNNSLKKEMDWDNYESMCSIANARLGGIAEKLKTIPNISPNDIRLCVLVLLDLSYEDIALMLNLSSKSIAKLKSITAHKLGTSMKNLHDKLTQLACSDEET